MKELQREFVGTGEVKGDKFSQVKQSEFAYIYRRIFNDGGECYEVFRRRENKQFNTVSYPKSKSFGIWAWCCSSLERAEKKFEEVNKMFGYEN